MSPIAVFVEILVAAPDFSSQPPVAQLLQALKGDPVLKDGHKELFIARAPGRLDLIGGITDYSGGIVCQYPLAASAAVALQRRDDRQLVIKNFTPAAPGAPAIEQSVTLSLDDFYGTASLLPHDALQDLFAGPRAWAASIAGAFPILARHKKITRSTHGATIACYSEIPAGSSAALTCAMLWAMTAANHLILDPVEIATLALRVDNLIAGKPVGIAGHATATLGKAGLLLALDCQTNTVQAQLPLPRGTFIAGIFTGRVGDVSAAYARRRVGAFVAHAVIARVYRDLGVKKDPTRGHLANVPVDPMERYFAPLLPERLTGAQFQAEFGAIADRVASLQPDATYEPRAAARHAIRETSFSHLMIDSLRLLAAQPEAPESRKVLLSLGQMMFDVHAFYSRATGLGTAEADLLVELLRRRGPEKGFLGAHLSGTGAAATVVLLADDTPAVRKELASVLADYRRETGLEPQLLTGSSPGASETPPMRVTVDELSA